jgi:uncharacterized protein (TIGR03437 family)
MIQPRLLPAILFILVASWRVPAQTYTITTFAGGGLPVNIPGTSASLYNPQSVAVDQAGNTYFAAGQVVLRLDAKTRIVTTVAGNGTTGFSGDNGLATNAALYNPAGVAVDSAGNLYIADSGNCRIRKVSNGVITTLVGCGNGGIDNIPATESPLITPTGIALDSAGNLYIADPTAGLIREVSNGKITTVAGNGTSGFRGDNGPATSAELLAPEGVAVDSAGNIYIADTGNFRIRKVTNGVISTLAGNGASGFSGDNGQAENASLGGPEGVAVDSAGNIYIADTGDNRIRKVSNGVIMTVAGTGAAGFGGDNGPATVAQLIGPAGITADSAGNLYITDSGNNRIREVSNGVIATIAGGGVPSFGDNGPAKSAQLISPVTVAVDSAGNLYIADTYNERIRKVSNGAITTVAGNGTPGFSGDNGPATGAQLSLPAAIAFDSVGNLYFADSANNRIRKVSGGIITTVAGNGTSGFGGDNGRATSAELFFPQGVALDSADNIYIDDTGNARVRKITNGVITNVAGNGKFGSSGDNGPATSAELFSTRGIAVDATDNLYIADSGSVRKVVNGVITTLAGGGSSSPGDNGPATSARLKSPYGIAVDAAGNLYIADQGDSRIRKVANGVITTLAGNGTFGFSGDNGPATIAQFNGPTGVAVVPGGNIYIADHFNERVRVLTAGTAPSITTNGIVPVYSAVPVVQPGSWVSIYGSDLASGNFLWNGDFPTLLGGTSVTIDGKPAYLWSVSPTQINLQVPDDAATGLVSVVVTTASGTAASTVTLASYGPSFIVLGDGKHAIGEIATPNGTGAYASGAYDLVGPSNTFSYSTRPVKAGETLVLYGVGFGSTTPSVPAGQVFSGSAAPTSSPVTITIGGVNAPVAFAGIVEAGLYQINLTVPANTGSGDRSLQATVNGVQTPTGPVVAVQ